MAHHQLILGGARSGKSRLGEQLALERATRTPLYVATATALDDEMTGRIERHRNDRNDAQWRVIEEPLSLARAIGDLAADDVVLIDCLTLWLTNCLTDRSWPNHRNEFFRALDKSPATILMVSNEVGLGVVPMGELTREFVDESGRLHQDLAAHCDEVTLTIAGLPHRLKPND